MNSEENDNRVADLEAALWATAVRKCDHNWFVESCGECQSELKRRSERVRARLDPNRTGGGMTDTTLREAAVMALNALTGATYDLSTITGQKLGNAEDALRAALADSATTDKKCGHPDLIPADENEEILAGMMKNHGILNCNGDRVFMARQFLAAGFVRRPCAAADPPPSTNADSLLVEPTEEMERLARKAVVRIKEELRHHETDCKCPACVAVGVLYGYHCVAAQPEKKEG